MIRSSQARIGLCYFDADLRYVEINEWLAALNGLTPAEHLGQTIRDILPSVADSVERQLRQVIQTGEPILEGLAWAETAAHSGTKRLYQHDYYADKGADGTVLGVKCTVQDITHQRLAEVRGIIPWEADARTSQFSYVGPQAEEILGYPVERWYESAFRDSCIHPDDRQRVIDLHSTSPRERQHYELEYRMIKADSTSIWLRDVVDVDSLGGEPIVLRGVMFDISALKEAQDKAEENAARLQHHLDTAPDALILVGGDGTILFANERVETVLGYSPAELTGVSLETLIPHPSRQAHASHQHDFFAAPTTRSMGEGMALSAVRKNGTELPVEISLSSLGTGENVIVTAAIRDVSRRVERERALCTASQEIEKLTQRLKQENRYLRDEIYETKPSVGLIGDSNRMREVNGLVEQVGPTDATVLITGETGTGKELVARSVHAHSSRADRLLVRVNCATLPANLIESELFGHEKGAFTGAVRQHIGRFELADGGAIFLDELGDLPLELQPKLLRVLQEGEFERLGSTKTINVDVRVIAATNRDLDQAVAAGEFRKDLYYRLQVFPIYVPPLRERPSDIPLLALYFLSHSKLSIGRPVESIPDDVMRRLERYQWPGNVRELENVIERAVILTSGTSLQMEESFGRGEVGHTAPPGALDVRSTRLEDVERAHIVSVLEACGWTIKGKSNAAERLGLHPSTVLHRMKKLGIERPSNTRQMAAPNGPP